MKNPFISAVLSIAMIFCCGINSFAQVIKNPLTPYNTAATTIFGMMTIRNNDINSRLVAANNLSVNYVRETQLLSKWNGSVNTFIDFWLSHDKKVILNVNNDSTPSAFPKNLTAYENKLKSFLNVYGSKIELAVIENEEMDKFDNSDSATSVSTLYHFGSMQDYINELSVAVNVCKQKGIPVTNGGLTTPIVASLKHYYDVSGKKDSSAWLVQQMQGVSPDSTLWLRTDSLLAAYKTLSLSYVNLHWYEPLKNMTRLTGVLPVLCNYITQKTGKAVITNETGVKTNDSSFVIPLMRQWESMHVKYSVFFDGAGSFGACPFTAANSALLANGIAFRNYGSGVSKSCLLSIGITPLLPAILCQGDSVKLTASPGLGNYYWSTGATTNSITVDKPGNYSVLSDMGNCIAFSLNTAVVIVNPLPAKPTITASSDLTNICPSKPVKLTASPSPLFLWNTGENTKIITANNSGTYKVSVTDLKGCKNASDSIVVTYAVCDPPGNLNVSTITTTQAVLNWDTANCSVGYRLQYRQKNTELWTSIDIYSSSVVTRSLNGLLQGTTYEWQIRTNGKTSPDTLASVYAPGPDFTTSGSLFCNAPNNLNVTDISTTKATLDWDTVINAIGYQCQYRVKGTDTWTIVPVSGSGTSQKGLFYLLPGTTYEWTVRTNCKNTTDTVSIYAAGPDFTTVALPPCDAPVNLSVTDITTTRATLDWDTVVNATGYQCQYRIKGTDTWTIAPVSGSGTSQKGLFYLLPGTTYEWTVLTNCKNTADTISAYAAGPDFTTVALPTCNAPVNLRVTDITNTKATINWDTAVNAVGYQYQYRIKGTSTWTTVAFSGSGNAQKTLYYLVPSTNYEWLIRTNCKNTTDTVSIYAAGPDFTTAALPTCNAPANLRISDITTTKATVGWDTASNAIGYQYQYRIKGTGTWTTVVLNGAGNAQKTIYYLIPGTTYEWLIRTNCKNTTDSVSVYAAGPDFTTVSLPVCNAPINLSVTAISTTKATLGWDTASSAVGYQCQYRIKGTTVWTIAPVSGGGTSQKPIFYLIPGTTYEWTVRTNCKNTTDSVSIYAAGPDFTTVALPVCNAPINLSVTAISTTKATLGWDTASSAVGYQCQYRIKGTTVWTIAPVTGGGTSQKPIFYLIPGTTYEWTVRTNCKNTTDSVSVYAAGPDFTTLGSMLCNAPNNLRVTDITTTKATINWDTAVNAIGYQYQYRIKGTGTWTTVVLSGSGNAQKTIYYLTPGTTYEWLIRTNCKNTTDTVSTYAPGPDFTTVSLPVCNAPINLSVTAISTTKATLGWDTASNAVGYQCQYRVKGATVWTIAPVTGGGTSQKPIFYLTPGTTYEWAVRTNCKNTTDTVSIYAAGPDFTTVALPACNAPTNLRVTGVTNARAVLGWDTASYAGSYQCQYRIKGTFLWTILPVTGGTTSQKTVYYLLPATTYEWGIRTNCKNAADSNSTYAAGPDFTTSLLFAQSTSNSADAATTYAFDAKVFPNPASTSATVSVSNPGKDLKIVLKDLSGRIVWQSSEITGNNTDIPVRNLANGLYILMVSNKDYSKMLKLVKE